MYVCILGGVCGKLWREEREGRNAIMLLFYVISNAVIIIFKKVEILIKELFTRGK